MSFLEDAWEEREEKVYKTLFGDIGKGIHPLDSNLFIKNFNSESVDPRWLTYGVFKSAPNKNRDSWLYVSSGMSNPWEADTPEEYSGLGVELIFETEEEADWAILAVQNLVAFNILLSVGMYGDKPLIEYGDRIPCAIEPNISNVMLVEPIEFPKTIKLISGKVDFLQLVGITSSELAFAKESGSSELAEILISKGISYVTNPRRQSVK